MIFKKFNNQLSVPIFSFLPCMVYPVGVTTYWCYFSWIITNNFANFYCILSKRGTKMHHYITYLCTEFQGNRIICFHFMATFTPLQKEKEKKKENKNNTKPIFERSYLGNAWRDLVEFWNVGYWRWRASPQQKLSGFVQVARSYIYVKIALFFFLSIYSRVWRASFLGRMTHYRVIIIITRPGAHTTKYSYHGANY